MKIHDWLRCHECVRRALRTFVQTAVGVAVAAVINAAGVIDSIDISALVALAVATGLAAVMNREGGIDEEDTEDDGSDEDHGCDAGGV